MPFFSAREAKQFLADRIYQQSEIEGAPISDLDRRLLLFSEQDPGSEEGIPEDILYDVDYEWEARMTSLLREAWKRDRDDPTERQRYLDALEALKTGDYYIQVIAGPVFGELATPSITIQGPSVAAFPNISGRRIALWAGVGIVLFVIGALIWVALTR